MERWVVRNKSADFNAICKEFEVTEVRVIGKVRGPSDGDGTVP